MLMYRDDLIWRYEDIKVNRYEDMKVNSQKCKEHILRSLCIARSEFIKSKAHNLYISLQLPDYANLSSVFSFRKVGY